MNKDAVQTKLEEGLEHHRRGNLREAEVFYREVLGVTPDQLDALNLLGLLYVQLNRPAEAETLLRQAIVPLNNQELPS